MKSYHLQKSCEIREELRNNLHLELVEARERLVVLKYLSLTTLRKFHHPQMPLVAASRKSYAS